MTVGDAISVVAFSPSGETVLTGSLSGKTRLWNPQTGKPTGMGMRHELSVLSAAFSRDGARIVTGSDDHTARVWDARTGKPIGQPMRHDGAVVIVAISPDSTTVLTGSVDHTARLWDARAGTPIGERMTHDDRISSAAFSPNGETVLTGSEDHTARLWDAKTGKPIGKAMQHADKVWAVAYSPDASMVATGSEDKTARVWDARTGEPVGKPMDHKWAVSSVVFSPDSASVLTGSGNLTARIWDARTGKPLSLPFEHEDKVESVAYSSTEATVMTLSNQTVRFWAVPRPIPNLFVADAAVLHSRMRMSDSGTIERVSTMEFADAWQNIEAHGAEWLARQRQHDDWLRMGWHRWQAGDAENKNYGFAAAFHLKWLLSSDPTNKELRRRFDRAKKKPGWPQLADSPAGVQFKRWFYSVDAGELSGSFQEEGSGWVETRDGKFKKQFEETARTSDYVELFDDGEKRWVRLTLIDSSTSSDHIAWTFLHKGSPFADNPMR